MDQRFVQRKAHDEEFYNKCWNLVRREGYTYREAGEILGVSKNIVAGVINRMRKRNERTNTPTES